MTKAAAPQPRKKPRQARSRYMVEVILEAAARVLEEEGAHQFTTNRVAERAGVSIGSLYQYYPGKAALLYHLHEQGDWTVWRRIEEILSNNRRSARARVRSAVGLFFAFQLEELKLRVALRDSRNMLRDSPGFQALDRRAAERVEEFLRATLPASKRRNIPFKARFALATITGLAETIVAKPMPQDEILRHARACADMLSDYLGL